MTTATIKAIETKYKGYRFRSRLEARWAVFFDHLGIDWRYEEQGYDLGPKLGWYLPDFYLPKFKEWVEIKPRPDGGPPPSWNVYLAGKMDSDWRTEWFGVRQTDGDEGEEWSAARIPGTRHRYMGPYLMDRGHGITGEAFHGTEDHEWEHGRIVRRSGWEESDPAVVGRCLSAIRKADIVIAWIESDDCHGTFAELGYAFALNKKIVLVHPTWFDPSPCWFPFRLSYCVISDMDAPQPQEIARMARLPAWVTEEEEKVNAVASQSSGRGYVMYGDPIDNLASFGTYIPHAVLDKHIIGGGKIQAAASAARTARFEHGERG